jgi:hypothetical protein
MKTLLLAALATVAASSTAAAATFYGPTPYTSQADAPYHASDFDNFYLEDLEDGAVNTPGLALTSSHCIVNANCFVGLNVADSVENGQSGRSVFSNGMNARFNATTLGAFPTFAGVVWTDGQDPISVTFFDQNGDILGTLTGMHADGGIAGETGEDRFYGAFNASGISRIFIVNAGGAPMETDHYQYGMRLNTAAVPEPATWSLMIFGFASLGAALRRRRAAANSSQMA